MIAGEMRTMRKEIEQDFAAKLGKVYDEVSQNGTQKKYFETLLSAISGLTWLGLCVGKLSLSLRGATLRFEAEAGHE